MPRQAPATAPASSTIVRSSARYRYQQVWTTRAEASLSRSTSDRRREALPNFQAAWPAHFARNSSPKFARKDLLLPVTRWRYSGVARSTESSSRDLAAPGESSSRKRRRCPPSQSYSKDSRDPSGREQLHLLASPRSDEPNSSTPMPALTLVARSSRIPFPVHAA